MKCLHVLPMNKLSGAEKLALILCKSIEKYTPIVVCGGDDLKSIFEQEGITAYSVDFKNNSLIRNISQLKKIIKQNDIKVVHAHDNNASVNCYLAKKVYNLKVKVISHIHNCYPWLDGNTKTKRIDKWFRKKYDYNIACGKLVYDYYINHTDYIDKEKISILSNCIDIDEIKKKNTNSIYETYKELNINENNIVFGFIGRLAKQKGLIPFIRELANYKDSFNNTNFLLVGSGDEEKEIKKLIRELNLQEKFILIGHQDDIYKYYPIIDVFFLPSLYEGLPMVILEAMSFGKPVVSMNVGSINEVIENNKSGVLIEQGDYKTFIKSLIDLKNNINISQYYGEEAFNQINKNYNIKNYQKEIVQIYDYITSK